MADIPTLAALQSQIENDLRTEFGITRTWVGKVALRIIAIVQAAKLKLFYLAIALLQKNIFVDTCDEETLVRFGIVKLGRAPNPARAGIYTINVTGSAGGVIEKGTIFKSEPTSTNPEYLFETTVALTLTGTTGTVEIRALTPGSDSTLQVDDELLSTIPIALVDSLVTIDSVDTNPVDAETTETYRRLIIESFQLEPQGGAATDYRIWAADAEGVRTVYAYTKNNAIQTVQVFVEALPANSAPGSPEGVPTQAMLDEVEAVIELDPDTTKDINARGRRPVQAIMEVLPVVPVGVNITINDLSDKTTATIAAITTALDDLLYYIRPYIAGADGVNKLDVLYLGQVIAAIYGAVGATVNFSNVEISINSVVYSSFTFSNSPGTYGQYPYLQTLITP